MSSNNGANCTVLIEQVTPVVDDEISAKRLAAVLRHIENVQDNCKLLGTRLIEQGRVEFGRTLIANGLIHDNSKLSGIEWEYLHEDVKETNAVLFQLAYQQHIKTNPHHIEFWGNIEAMPEIYIAEMICDWKSRSSEFGTDFWLWVKEKATKKYKFTIHSRPYKSIKNFADLLLDMPF